MMDSCPMLYAQAKLSMIETCMCFGIEAGEGWFNPLNKLSHRLERLNESYKKDRVAVQAAQVKEKYGTLRFYYDIVYIPTWFKQKLINGFRHTVNFIKKHVKFNYKKVIDQDEYISEEWIEISKEDYDSRKIPNYVSNNFTWKFKEENGKYYRNSEVHHPVVLHYELQNHKFLNWIINKLNSVSAKLKCYKPTYNQEMIYAALDEETRELVAKCEDECYNYCETCGRQIGVLYSPRCQTKGWITFICKNCAEKHSPGSYLIDGKDPFKKTSGKKKSNQKKTKKSKDNK